MRLWRKSASPEPAAASNAAAGARYGSAQERLKGDAQETARQRLVIASAIFAMVFVVVGLRMSYVSLLRDGAEPTQRVAARGGAIQSERADIVDRNGIVLATSVPVMSAFVNPRLLLDPQDAARKIVSALPDLKYDEVREKLEGDRTFVWVKRGLTPREHDGSIGWAFRASSSSPRSAGSTPRARRRRTSWAMPASTIPAWPASSATSTSSCRAARRCSLRSICACSA